MDRKLSIKTFTRLTDKTRERDNAACPIQQRNLHLLISSQCKFYGHPKRKGEERCFCQDHIPVSA